MGDVNGSIAKNLASIRDRIERAAARASRRADQITLVAVSKGVPPLQIREAYAEGVRHFGENRVQEWESKIHDVCDLEAMWHFVGHLQRNKADKAVNLFHCVDSLDGLPLAERLNRAAGDGRRLPVLLEVRLDPGGSKSGCDPAELPRLGEGIMLLQHLELRGLMTIPPLTAGADEARPFFRRLRELRDELERRLSVSLPELSMGMSADFEQAIEEGATQIRLGTAIFGARTAARRRK
jgi:pyridoxal phosphate enzyme (YggS family)